MHCAGATAPLQQNKVSCSLLVYICLCLIGCLFMARFSLPLAGGAGRSLRGTAGLLRSLREQARLSDVPSLLDVGVAVDVEAGDVFSAAGLFGDILGSFLKELLPVDSSAARKRANKRSKNLNLDSNKGTED